MLKKLFYFIFIFTICDAHAANQLNNALKAVENSDIKTALNLKHSMKAHSLDSKILAWAIAMANIKGTSSYELAQVIENLSSWPAQNKIKANYEIAVYNELLKTHKKLKIAISPKTAKAFLNYFNNNPPLTAYGMVIYLKSATIDHQLEKALSALRKMWLENILSAEQQKLLLANSENLLSPIDHFHRLQMLLLHKAYGQAIDIAKKANATKTANLFIRAMSNNKSLEPLKTSNHYGMLYQYAYIQNCIKQKKYQEAASALLTLPHSKNYLISPDIWAKLHFSLAHDLVYIKQGKLAYHVLQLYNNESPSLAIKREFYSGWIALRLLEEPRHAITHFINIVKHSKNSINLAKAYYWLARSHEVLKEKKHTIFYYNKAANFNTAFYGQLSSAWLAPKKTIINYPHTSLAEQKDFNNLEAVKALQKLISINDKKYSRILSLDLAQSLDSAGKLAFLASIESAYGDYYAALKIAKIGASRGFNMGLLTHPFGSIDGIANLSNDEKAMIYAVARQESEFNKYALSNAGARGLMQIMPKTAHELAKHTGFSLKKLSNNASYNAKLGNKLLRNQLKRFKGSYLLTFAAYNAGNHKVEQWIKKYGDPRQMSLVQIIDWVENIPYSETRNYTKRVFENYEAYKIILTGKANLTKDLVS